MTSTHISFYLRSSRVHVFAEMLRGIGSPRRICFMIEENGETLLVAPYSKVDLKSHAVPDEIYKGTGQMEVCSIKLCRLISQIHGWDLSQSYRIPGIIKEKQKVAVFYLKSAEVIEKSE